jgi:hypothetical protein
MYFVSITRLRLRSIWYLPAFMFHALRSGQQSTTDSGNFGFDTRAESGLVFWTKTIWTEEAAMKRFRNSGAHQKTMRYLASWCDQASYVHWLQATREMPSWEVAHQRLLQDGKLSKLKHPSPQHLAQQTAPPLY